MRKYHSLKVVDVQRETPDSVRIAMQVPEELRGDFHFLAGQHLPVQIDIDGRPVRRTYSIFSTPDQALLEIGVRIQPGGQFSAFAANKLSIGDQLQVMPPFGQFHANTDVGRSRTSLAFAAGSGITPILSILRTTLEQEATSRFVLFYGNRRQQTTMFIDELYALKNRFPERLQLYFLFSQEEQEFKIFGGRLDSEKVSELCSVYCAGLQPDEAFICGPGTMIEAVRTALLTFGMRDAVIHAERYGAQRKSTAGKADSGVAIGRQASINVILDGHRKTFSMACDGNNIVDAAAAQGIDLPYSCKGGVCATCRTFVRSGEVSMETNYGLEPWEVRKGFVLACQSVPVSDSVTLDYDKT